MEVDGVVPTRVKSTTEHTAEARDAASGFARSLVVDLVGVIHYVHVMIYMTHRYE